MHKFTQAMLKDIVQHAEHAYDFKHKSEQTYFLFAIEFKFDNVMDTQNDHLTRLMKLMINVLKSRKNATAAES